jgi:signal transduction histidine kinase
MNSLFLWCLFADLMAITGLILAAVDSGRKQAVAALRVSNEILDSQVQERTGELLQANLELHAALAERWRLQMEMNQISEERQKMIGQELHDGLGQQLTGIAFLVSSLHETLGIKSAPEVPAIRQVKDLLVEAMSVIRALSRGLYPVALETGGLSSALHHLSEYAQSTSGVQCVVRCTINTHLIDKTIALNLYRIAQEAVCNGLRHSKAQLIEIKLSETGEHYRLSIKDNGIGFPSQAMKTSVTLGLRSMRNRADLIGANIEIRENPGGGSVIIVMGHIKRED